MRLYNIKLLTIVCEIMAQNLVKEILKKHKITGYTLFEVGGMGDKGLRERHTGREDGKVQLSAIWEKICQPCKRF